MNWKRSLIAIAFAIPLILLFAYGFTRDPSAIVSPLPGNAAPAFALPVFAPGEPPLARAVGDTIQLPDLAGQVVIVNFWASWCLACRDEHVTLSQTARSYANQQAHFLGVLYNDRPAAGLRWIADMGGQSYPSLLDERSRTAIDYGLSGVPETFIIDRGGRIAYKHMGPISDRLLRRWIDSLLPPNVSGDTALRPVAK